MITWNLPGLWYNRELYQVFFSLLEHMPEWFNKDQQYEIYGCFPGMVWNAGRLVPIRDMRIQNVENYRKVFEGYVREGVQLNLTMSNHLLTEDLFKDALCNEIMSWHDEYSKLGAIVTDLRLARLLKEKYPDMKLTGSTIISAFRDEDYYQELLDGDLFDKVVLSYNMNQRVQEVPKKYREKCELLVNENCVINCPKRREHYDIIARDQIRGRLQDSFQCIYSEWNPDLGLSYISPDEIKFEYVPLGFKEFKIEGRTRPKARLVQKICDYLIKDEYKMEAMTVILVTLTDMGWLATEERI